MIIDTQTADLQEKMLSAKRLTSARLSLLQKFIEQVKDGKIIPLQEKTRRAFENLRRAGLIK